ncbi:MAG: hypothetical protein JWR63_1615 [Conexibacter sp.]|nr:hypothetical protein [Conexibacter sp.]
MLEFNHYYFEDLRDFGPEAQFALSVIYRDAFAVLDTIGWSPEPDAGTVDVPFTDGHIEQLRRCRLHLGHANIDRIRIRVLDDADDDPIAIRAAIDIDRVAAQALDHLFGTYALKTSA